MLKIFLKRMSRTAEFIAAMMLAAIFYNILITDFFTLCPKNCLADADYTNLRLDDGA